MQDFYHLAMDGPDEVTVVPIVIPCAEASLSVTADVRHAQLLAR
jgi:hypothetical protein